MSKAILITDMPESCFECRHRIKIDPENYFCLLLNSKFEERFEFIQGKRKDCPLKPLPQKKNPFEEHMKVERNERYISELLINQIRGYNFCIDEILGEENE